MSDDVVRDALAEFQAELTSALVPAAASGYGIDLVCVDDFTPGLDETDPASTQSLSQDNYHRLITDPETLPDDLDYGLGIESYLSKGVTDAEMASLEGAIETELLKDDRNASIDATVTRTGYLPATYSITVVCTPADPDAVPFKLVIAVTPQSAFLEAVL